MKKEYIIHILKISFVRSEYRNMEASKPKCVNSDNVEYGVNSLRLGGYHMCFSFEVTKHFLNNYSLL